MFEPRIGQSCEFERTSLLPESKQQGLPSFQAWRNGLARYRRFFAGGQQSFGRATRSSTSTWPNPPTAPLAIPTDILFEIWERAPPRIAIAPIAEQHCHCQAIVERVVLFGHSNKPSS